MKKHLSILCATLMLMGVLFPCGYAYQYQYDDGGGDEKYCTKENWTGDTLRPQAGDTATFDATSVENCTIDSNIVVTYFNADTAYKGTISFGATVDSLSRVRLDGIAPFVDLVQTSRGYQCMCTDIDGDIYVCVYNGDIYKQSNGTGDFIALSQTTRLWQGIGADFDGDIYASVGNGDIYKQTAGTGDFLPLNQTSRNWIAITADLDSNVYCVANAGDIYVQAKGVGDFVAMGMPARGWTGMCTDIKNNVYASAETGIYIKTFASDSFVLLDGNRVATQQLGCQADGDVWAVEYGVGIFKRNVSSTGTTGSFISQNQAARNWAGTTVDLDGEVYAAVYGGSIYKMSPNVLFNTSKLVISSDFKSQGYAEGSRGTSTLMFNGTGLQVARWTGLLYDIDVSGTGNWFTDSSGVKCNEFKVSGVKNLKHVGAVTCADDWLVNTACTTVVLSSITATGAASQVHLQSTAVPTMTACLLSMNTLNNGVMDFDVSATILGLVIGASDTVTNSGGVKTIINAAGNAPLTLVDGGALILTKDIELNRSTTGYVISILGGYPKISQSATETVRFKANGIKLLFPKLLISTGTQSAWNITADGARTNDTLLLTDTINLNCGTSDVFRMAPAVAGHTQVFQQDGKPILIPRGDLSFGSGNATAALTAYFNGPIKTKTINATSYNTGTTAIYDTAMWTDSGNITIQSGHTYAGAMGKHTVIGTATITSNGKEWCNKLTINASGKTVTAADAVKVDSLIGTAGTLVTSGSGTDSVDNYLQLAGANLTMGNPLVCGYFDVDNGNFLMTQNNLTCTNFAYDSDDSLSWDGDITTSGSFHYDSVTTKKYWPGNLYMTGDGNFDWDKAPGTNRLTGDLHMGYAGKTVTWTGAGTATPVLDGGQLIIEDATGTIAGYPKIYWYINANDTPYNFNGATLNVDSSDFGLFTYTSCTTTVNAFNGPNANLEMRSWTPSGGGTKWDVVGDITCKGLLNNTQYNYRNEYDYNGNTLAIGEDGAWWGNNGSAVTLVTGIGAFTSTGRFLTNTATTSLEAGAGTYAVSGNLTISSGPLNNMGTAAWTLNGTGAQAISADSLYSLAITNTGGTVSTAKSIGIGSDFTVGAGVAFDCSADTVRFAGNVTTNATATLTSSAASLWRLLKDGVTAAVNGLSWPKVALSGSAIFTGGGTFANLVSPAAGGDTVTFDAKRYAFTAFGSNGVDVANRLYLQTTSGIDTLNLPGTVTLQHVNAKNQYSEDTVRVTAGGTDQGGNRFFWWIPSISSLLHPMGRVAYKDTIVGTNFSTSGGVATLGGTAVTLVKQVADTVVWTVPTKSRGTYNFIYDNGGRLYDTVAFRVLVPSITGDNP